MDHGDLDHRAVRRFGTFDGAGRRAFGVRTDRRPFSGRHRGGCVVLDMALGALGLLLSTPLTLCLVVLARHVERLQFIDVILGDQPALTPQQAAYQRMLTGDPSKQQPRSFLKEGSVQEYYDEILLGALRLAEADATLGRLDNARLENIHQTVSEIIEDLAAHGAANVTPSGKRNPETARSSTWTRASSDGQCSAFRASVGSTIVRQ